jgi:hypothetical protein
MTADDLANLLDQIRCPRDDNEISRSAGIFATEISEHFQFALLMDTIRHGAMAIGARLMLDGTPHAIASRRAQLWASAVLEHMVASAMARLQHLDGTPRQ